MTGDLYDPTRTTFERPDLPPVDRDTPTGDLPHQSPRLDHDAPTAGFMAAGRSTVDLVAMSALTMAVSEIGTGETPPGSNHTPYWGEVYPPANGPGMDWAWCAGFQTAMYLREGCDLRRVVPNPFYCPSIEAWARSHGWWKTSGPLAGDLVLYGLPGEASPHIGMHERVLGGGYYQAIEGNTSPGTAGSQDDGGGVYRRSRPASWIHGWVDMRAVADHYTHTGVWSPVDGFARQREMADAGITLEMDGIYGPDTAQKWNDLMSTIDDVLAKLDDLGRKVDAVATTASKVRQAVIPTLTTEEKIVAGTRSDELSAGALLRILLRRASRVNSITGAVNPDAAAQYDANLKAKTEAGR